MSSSFTDGTTAVLPIVVNGYAASRTTRHVFNDVLGSDTQDVLVRPAGLRSGTLAAVFATYDDAAALYAMLAGTTPVTFSDSDRPALGMKFLGNGQVQLELDDETRDLWIVSLPFQEVR